MLMDNESSMARPEADEPDERLKGLGAFGMKVFLASLSMLFVATIIGYLYTWSRAETWPPPNAPHLPTGLWYSTLVILLTSASIQWALGAARVGNQGVLRITLLITTVLGLLFLVLQAFNWSVLIQQQFTVRQNLYAFLFYLLTGLHAAHVIGGIVPLLIVTRKAFKGAYTAESHPGVKYSAMYWHFLDIVWIVLFFVLLITR